MVSRPKEGFVMPVTDWLLHGLEDYVRQTLSPSRLPSTPSSTPTGCRLSWTSLYRGQHDYRLFVNKVLALVVFQEWHDMYMMGGE